mgnify:CR=1 FL=1
MNLLNSLSTLAVAACCLCHMAIASDESRPNIILLMADDLGYGHLGSYGQQKILTPHIDRLAAEGMRFTHAYSGSSVCAPSRSVLMTGLHTGHTPIRWNTPGGATLEDDDITLAEQLKAVGYRTGGFGKWGLGKENTPGHPNRQGFDEFFGQYDQVHAHFFYPWWVWHNEEKVMLPENENGKRGTYVHDITHLHALAFIRSSGSAQGLAQASETGEDGSPFFAYLPYIIPHVELIVPEDSKKQYLGKFPKHTIHEKREGYLYDEDSYTAYAGMISRLDDAVGEISALLVELGIDDNTLFIFTSDNGAQGSTWDDLVTFFDGTGGLRGSKGSLYEGGIRVPMIARWPGRIAADTSSDIPTVHYDLFPTLGEIAGAEEIKTDGTSLTGELFGGDKSRLDKRPYLFWQTPGACAVRSGNWKLVRTDQWLPWELYDLGVDPAEANNLADENRDTVFRLSRFAKASYRTERDNDPTGPRTSHLDYVR